MKRNPTFKKLKAGYLFPEVKKRVAAFLIENPKAELISLSIGDTSLPIPPKITHHLITAAKDLGNQKNYKGYGPEQGYESLRKSIAQRVYKDKLQADDIFISDGAKCDIGRIQALFGFNQKVAIQDPAYPVYVDSSVIYGHTQEWDASIHQYQGITYLQCLPENNFFPLLPEDKEIDLLFFCSPNNPTGAVATRDELKKLVDFALRKKCVIVFDAAYSCFIQHPSLPKSIFEIEGAENVAIEISSFSKMCGFTGVRLGWTAMSSKLLYEDGTSIKEDWKRLITTLFNGASNIAQYGGEAALNEEGLLEMDSLIHYYMSNAKILKKTFEDLKLPVYGGENAPYLWVDFKKESWTAFEELLHKAHVISTPGSGFGSQGDGFLRFTAFGDLSKIEEAASRIKRAFE